jgi:TPR repeat protein
VQDAEVPALRAKAAAGDVAAQSALGVYYESRQDFPEAVSWYRKAADQGDAFAQNNLGAMYDIGRGVPQDYAQAVSWYRKAADQGDAYAQNNLGVMYAKGQGVLQDYVSAYFWYTVAEARGTYDTQKEAAKDRDDIAAKMTPQQVADAQELAREWLEALQKRGGK